jgi:transposase-like protein
LGKEKKEQEEEIKVGGKVYCALCGSKNEITMTYAQNKGDPFTSQFNRFHCSSCGSNVEFRLIWDWDIEKVYR